MAGNAEGSKVLDSKGFTSITTYSEADGNVRTAISRMENGQYKVRYEGVDLSFSVATPENAKNVLVMTEQALVQYESCKAQHGLLSSLQKQFIDCTFSAEETVSSGMEISLNDSMLPFSDTSVIHEEQFRKALERLVGKRGEKI